ncbi:MAG: hypothetical protein ACPGVB_10995 [Chitinophagales bacterium]
MAKKRNKRKKSSGGAPVKLTPQKYIKTRARKLPFYKCFVNDSWEEGGMAVIVVARQQGGDKLVVGLYLVDTWCLGLKDTHFHFRMDNYEFENEFLQNVYRDEDPEEIDERLAQNLIYGAIEYAEDLGFAPHGGFKLTEYILDPVGSLEEIDLEFGKDGVPHYTSGPNDDVNKIMNVLAQNIGMGNFHYTVGSQVFEGEGNGEDDEDFAEDIEFEEAK